jgi:hypothetical protein
MLSLAPSGFLAVFGQLSQLRANPTAQHQEKPKLLTEVKGQLN